MEVLKAHCCRSEWKWDCPQLGCTNKFFSFFFLTNSLGYVRGLALMIAGTRHAQFKKKITFIESKPKDLSYLIQTSKGVWINV